MCLMTSSLYLMKWTLDSRTRYLSALCGVIKDEKTAQFWNTNKDTFIRKDFPVTEKTSINICIAALH